MFDDSFEHEAGYDLDNDYKTSSTTDVAESAETICQSHVDSMKSSSSSSSSDCRRIVLVVDIWHPDFSDEEVKCYVIVIAAEYCSGNL